MKSPEFQSSQEFVPINETETHVSYLGVSLEKASDRGNAPNPEQYKDFIDNKFSLSLQRDIAVSFAQGDPVLIEGGTSIGKSTTVRKMASELGWEVHYVNLNGSTDASDLMGRYVPNPKKTGPDDPEYVFADGKVTSGLRQEEGKKKIIMLDEFNASTPGNLIRLHEILDAIERNAEVVLSEDASEVISTNRTKTHLVALINPPGKGFMQREALDPAQLRRWVYLKAPSELPKEAFSEATDSLFHTARQPQEIPEEAYLFSNEAALKPEQLADIPGMTEITDKFKEFHRGAKELVAKRVVAQDQPQPFTYDDRMEPRRVRDFICRFYRGDISETFQAALRYYYAGKLLDKVDKDKLNELIKHVEYVAPAGATKRKGLNMPTGPNTFEGPTVQEAEAIFERIGYPEGFIGPKKVEETFGFAPGSVEMPPIPFRPELLERCKELGLQLVLQVGKTDRGESLTCAEMMERCDETMGDKGIEVVGLDLADFNETPRFGWKLASNDLITGTENLNYLEQSEELLSKVPETLFGAGNVSEKYQKAAAEFAGVEELIAEALEQRNFANVADSLKKLYATNLLREKASEVIYRMYINKRFSLEDMIPKSRVWTSSSVNDSFIAVKGLEMGERSRFLLEAWTPSQMFPADTQGPGANIATMQV